MTGDRSIAFATCVASCRNNVRTDPKFPSLGLPAVVVWALLATEDEIVAVDHLCAAGIAEDQQRVG